MNGVIKPKLAGVAVALQKNIDISSANSEDAAWKTVQTFESDQNGQWSAGPLDTDSRYRVVASKDGYNFQAPLEVTKSVAKSKIVLHHSKLASLKIIVKDSNDLTGLQGVLLSLSGDDYRKNDVTGNDGVLNFHSLFPGSYYVRPMLKEYEFTPKSNSFDLESSSNSVFEFKAKRVAFSIFGTLSTIVGEPSVDTIVVAIDGASKEILEAVSNSDGEYRMRGLKRGRKYTVKVNGRKKQKKHQGRQRYQQRCTDYSRGAGNQDGCRRSTQYRFCSSKYTKPRTLDRYDKCKRRIRQGSKCGPVEGLESESCD